MLQIDQISSPTVHVQILEYLVRYDNFLPFQLLSPYEYVRMQYFLFLLPLQVTTALFLAKKGDMFKVTHFEASKCCISKALSAITTSPDLRRWVRPQSCVIFLSDICSPYRQEINVRIPLGAIPASPFISVVALVRRVYL